VIQKEKRKSSRTRGGDFGLSPLFWTFGAGIMSSTDSSEASKSATFLQMRRLKLEAIEKGQGTDCSFLVGQDKNTASVSHQISQIIVWNTIVQLTFLVGALLQGRLAFGHRVFPGHDEKFSDWSLSRPHQTHPAPHLQDGHQASFLIKYGTKLLHFKMFKNRFISVHHLDEISNVEDAVLLALAAEEFLLEPLKTFSCLEIERMVTVENVWRTLNSTCLIPKLAATCSKVKYIFYKDKQKLYFSTCNISGAFFWNNQMSWGFCIPRSF